MRLAVTASAALIALGALATGRSAEAATKDGKTIFLEHRCNLCHSVNELGIPSKLKEKGHAVNAPDLSNASSLIPSEDWLDGFLHKEKETKDGKTHPMKFVEGHHQMQALADWLMSLKTGVAASSSGSSTSAGPRER